jgi:jumonji domain-containing protein 7
MHKDHYENLFYVLSGEKVFTLCPPADAAFMYQDDFDSGVFCQENDGKWIVRQEYDEDENNHTAKGPMPSQVKWIEGEVAPRIKNENKGCREKHLLLALAHPINVHVQAGEMLYLPALWFHRVTQTCETVGVNYWYDMRFDSPHWCYFNFVQQLEVHTPSKASLEEN